MTILPEQSARPSDRGPRPWVLVALVVAAAVIVAAVVLVTRGGGKTSGDDRTGGAQPTTGVTGSAPQAHAWRAAVNAVSQPAPVGDRFVVYAEKDGALQLVGLDAASGDITWTLPASPSVIAPGTAPRVAVMGDRVVYLESAGGQLARIVAADASTGEPAWHSPSGAFSGWPAVCPDDAGAVCISGQLVNGSTAGALRFDAETGRSLPSPQISDGARELAPNLFDLGERHPEVLAATNGSKVAWRQPLSKIFTLKGSSTDYGWNFDPIRRIGLYVGSVGTPALRETSTRYDIDLSKTMTAGFRTRDGSVVWRDLGTQYVCSYLACPGGSEPAFSSAADAQNGGPTLGLRVRAHGVISSNPDTIDITASPDSRGVLEGFDPATGHVRWTFDFGHDAALLGETRLPPRVSTNEVVLQTPTRQLVVLNLLTGAKTPVRADTLAYCSKIISYHMTVPYEAGGRSIHEYVGQYAVSPCTPAGRPTAAPARGTASLNGLLAKAQGEFAWTEQGAVVAVPA